MKINLLDTRKNIFTVRVVTLEQPREVVEVSFLETFQVRLNEALKNLT